MTSTSATLPLQLALQAWSRVSIRRPFQVAYKGNRSPAFSTFDSSSQSQNQCLPLTLLSSPMSLLDLVLRKVLGIKIRGKAFCMTRLTQEGRQRRDGLTVGQLALAPVKRRAGGHFLNPMTISAGFVMAKRAAWSLIPGRSINVIAKPVQAFRECDVPFSYTFPSDYDHNHHPLEPTLPPTGGEILQIRPKLRILMRIHRLSKETRTRLL